MQNGKKLYFTIYDVTSAQNYDLYLSSMKWFRTESKKLN